MRSSPVTVASHRRVRRGFTRVGQGWFGTLASALLIGACTLTADDFQPQVVSGRAQPGAPSGMCAGGAMCCAAAPCPAGQDCLNGLCGGQQDAGVPPCVGTDCPAMPPPVLLDPRCDDRVTNGDESGVDCGGSCTQRCQLGAGCRTEADCVEGASCPQGGGLCAPPSCTDRILNGSEVQIDCGGGTCQGCPAGTSCEGDSDCASGVCDDDGQCAEPTCNDEVRNGTELGTDCAGGCPAPCPAGVACNGTQDCASGVCGAQGCAPGVATCCQQPSCTDGVANGGEPVPDCGNAACGPCSLGELCLLDAHCASLFCDGGRCADPGTCTDTVRNGRESSPDCGGGRCPVCPDLSFCNQDSDCFNQNCDGRGICISCGDGTTNGTETDIDCGGDDPFCDRCPAGRLCLINGDCANGLCFNFRCN